MANKQTALTPDQMYKLGTIVTDSACGMKGMLTHLQFEVGDSPFYYFVPRGLNTEDGSPMDGQWISQGRVLDGVPVQRPYIPMHILGTKVMDKATGFSGTAVSMILHLTGCIHVSVQPKGKRQKNGELVKRYDFDINRLEGPALEAMKKEQATNPAPKAPGPIEVETDRHSAPPR